MGHSFLPYIPIYYQCTSCGYVEGSCLGLDDVKWKCSKCNLLVPSRYLWFPDTIYEYAIMIEDYFTRCPSKRREKYFETQKEENAYEFWCSMDQPEFKPVEDWKPITILLFRSLFESLIEHFLWNLIYVEILPSVQAEKYAAYILNENQGIGRRVNKTYLNITGNTLKKDMIELGYEELYRLLLKTARIRNEFIHNNPHAGYEDINLSKHVKESVPALISVFVKLANKYIHPVCLRLRDIKILNERDNVT